MRQETSRGQEIPMPMNEGGESDDQKYFLHSLARDGKSTELEAELKKESQKSAVNEPDNKGLTCLQYAAAGGHVQCVSVLLDEDKTEVDIKDTEKSPLYHILGQESKENVNPLIKRLIERTKDDSLDAELLKHAMSGEVDMIKKPFQNNNEIPKGLNFIALDVASRFGNDEVAKFLSDNFSEDEETVRFLKEKLQTAINSEHKKITKTLLESKQWKTLLGYTDKDRGTGMRDLITKMPDIAVISFDQCKNEEQESTEFVSSFIDDPFFKNPESIDKVCGNCQTNCSACDNCCYSAVNWKETHPLMTALQSNNFELMNHKLLRKCIENKWSRSMPFFVLFIIYYAAYLANLSAYLLTVPKPHITPYVRKMDESQTDNGTDEIVICPEGRKISQFEAVTKYTVWVLVGTGMLIEIFQFVRKRWLYLKDPSNLLDWFGYVSALLLMIDFAACGLRTDWQWQMGVFTLLIIWFNLIIFLQRSPYFGIYITMMLKVFRSFGIFFVIFLLLTISFAISFHLLIPNQAPFSTPFYAIVRTMVMMIGEYEMAAIFHSDLEDYEVAYRGPTYAIFIIFALIVGILVMNLLIGLAVDDVDTLRATSEIARLTSKLDYALDMEIILPSCCLERMERIVKSSIVTRTQEFLKKVAEKLGAISPTQSSSEKETMKVPDNRQLYDQVKKISEELKTIQDLLKQIKSGQSNPVERTNL